MYVTCWKWGLVFLPYLIYSLYLSHVFVSIGSGRSAPGDICCCLFEPTGEDFLFGLCWNVRTSVSSAWCHYYCLDFHHPSAPNSSKTSRTRVGLSNCLIVLLGVELESRRAVPIDFMEMWWGERDYKKRCVRSVRSGLFPAAGRFTHGPTRLSYEWGRWQEAKLLFGASS